VPAPAIWKRPSLSLVAPVKAPAGVAEELALQELAGEGRAVDGHEGLVAAFSREVDRAGDELLAGAALAGDEHRGARGATPADGLEDLAHPGRAADDVVDLEVRGEGLDEAVEAAGEVAGLHGAEHGDLEALDVDGLDQVVPGAALHGGDGAAHVVAGGDDQHRGLVLLRGEGGEHLQAVEPGRPRSSSTTSASPRAMAARPPGPSSARLTV
jgi:hypothetical protein